MDFDEDPWRSDPRGTLSELQKSSSRLSNDFIEDDDEQNKNPFEFEQSHCPIPITGKRVQRQPSSDISNAQSERDDNDPLLATILVDFHHNLGPIIEFCHPPNLIEDSEFSRLLPFVALPDGAHMTEEDFSYFHLKPPSDGKLGDSTIFGISCNRQLKASDLIEKSSHVTRSIVQKAIVVLTKKPVFGPIRDKLGVITKAFFSQRNFNELQLLVQFHQSLEHSLQGYTTETVLNSGTNLRELVLKFKHKTLVLLKLLLLQKRILFFGYKPLSKHPLYPVERLCTFQYSLVSLIPNLLNFLSHAASPDLPPVFGNRPVTSLRTSDRESLLRYVGMPLDLFGKTAFFQPYMPLQQIDILSKPSTNSFLAGTTNAVFTQQKNIKLDVIVNIETGTLEFPQGGTPGLEKLVSLTSQDKKWMDDIVNAVHDSWNRHNNVLTKDSAPVSFIDSDDYLRAKFEDYICSALSSIKYNDYIKYGGGRRSDGLMSGNSYERNPTSAFGDGFVNTLRSTTAFIDWNMRTDQSLFDLIEPRHPNSSNNIFGLRLSEGLNELHSRENKSERNSNESVRNGSEKMKSVVGGWGAYIADKARNSLQSRSTSQQSTATAPNDETESAWQSPWNKR